MTPALFGSEPSHFTLSFTVEEQISHNQQMSTNHNAFEEKGELKRNRTNARLLTILIPLRVGQTGSHTRPYFPQTALFWGGLVRPEHRVLTSTRVPGCCDVMALTLSRRKVLWQQ